MTTFEALFIIVMACGVLCIAVYLAWLWADTRRTRLLDDRLGKLLLECSRANTAFAGAIAERDSARAALDLANKALAQTTNDIAEAKRSLTETRSTLETTRHRLNDIETLRTAPCEDCALAEPLGRAAYQAWQAAGGRGRTKAEQALLEQFAPHDPGADQ